MGGWCEIRDKCANHRVSSRVIIERLCEPGQTDAYIRFHEPKRWPFPIHTRQKEKQ